VVASTFLLAHRYDSLARSILNSVSTTLRCDWRDATTACAVVDDGRSLTSNG